MDKGGAIRDSLQMYRHTQTKSKEMIKEGHYITIKRSIEQEDIMCKYLCTQKFEVIINRHKGRNSNVIIDVNTPTYIRKSIRKY